MSFEIKRNDTRPWFVVALKDDFGEPSEAPVNLTAASGARFNMKATSGTAIKVSRGSAAITSAANGEITYCWGTSGSADTGTSGTYDAEVEVLWADGKVETFPGGPSGGTYWTILISDDIA